jgi:hypothetical protein
MDVHIPGWLWPIMSLGGLGALVDFLLGETGRKRTRSFLETWWIIFSDVHWRNFGQKEALLTVWLIDRYCGRFFSIRRTIFVLSIFTISVIIGLVSMLVTSRTFIYPLLYSQLLFGSHLTIGVIGLSCSLSFTRNIALLLSRLCGRNTGSNFLIAGMSLIITYILICLWTPTTQTFGICLLRAITRRMASIHW